MRWTAIALLAVALLRARGRENDLRAALAAERAFAAAAACEYDETLEAMEERK